MGFGVRLPALSTIAETGRPDLLTGEKFLSTIGKWDFTIRKVFLNALRSTGAVNELAAPDLLETLEGYPRVKDSDTCPILDHQRSS